MKLMVVLTCVALGYVAGFAADKSEKGVRTSPLTIYSGGIAVGASVAASDELRGVSNRFAKLSLVNSVYFTENLSLFLDVNWFIRGTNIGADAGIDYVFANPHFRPIIGMGVGAHHIDRDNAAFGENFGPSATVHFGFILDLTDALQVRLRVPYHAILNEKFDQMAGFDLSFLFSGRYRKVKKLHYN